ncbi:MAG: N,N-dimethylformamidase beta subunit family domain-containing protein [Pirellulales bacterium]
MTTPPFTRRGLLKGAVAGSLALTSSEMDWAHGKPAKNELIVQENRLPGTRDWMLSNTRVDPATKYRCPQIEGYCSHTSIRAGETIQFYISTNPASSYTLDIYRMGYYGGAGGRWLKQLGPLAGALGQEPAEGPKRLRNCQWPVSAELVIPDDWVSGVYVGKLTAAHEKLQSYVIFIVRDDRPVDLLFQCSDHTWQAYNRWPSQFALYDDGESQWYWGGDVQVSFNRPYGKYCQILDQPLTQGSGEFFLWEYPFVYWLESHGYDVSYLSNQDTHFDPARILQSRGFLSVGHDEYWTLDMFRNVQHAIRQGVSVGFFSGDAVFGRIDYDPGSRAFERLAIFGPPGGTRDFASIRTLPHQQPYANSLIGAHSTGQVTGGADWVCKLPDHWIYQQTGMKQGDSIPGMIGWEWHGDPAPITGLEIVASGPTQSAPGKPNGGEYTATVYPGPQDNFVFNASTCWWADGLSEPPGYVRPQVYTTPLGPDRRIEQITQNVLNRMIGAGGEFLTSQ